MEHILYVNSSETLKYHTIITYGVVRKLCEEYFVTS